MAFHRDREGLDALVIRLGSMAGETIGWGTEVLLNGDLQKEKELIELDDSIDELSAEIEEHAYSILALQAPNASDLRRVVAVIKVVAELERSADLMISLCKAARRMQGSTISPKINDLMSAMSEEASRLLSLSINAFADGDVSVAAALSGMDDALDQLNSDVVEAIFDGHSSDEIDMKAAVQLALVARYYERIGDHAVNIGNRVTYMVTGLLPEDVGTGERQDGDSLVSLNPAPDVGSDAE